VKTKEVKTLTKQNAGNILADLLKIKFENLPSRIPGVIRNPPAAKKPKTPYEPNLSSPIEKLKW